MEKIKKYGPYILIIIFVLWFSYKFFVERKISTTGNEEKMALDWDQLDANSGSKPEDVPASIKTKDPELKSREHSTLTPTEDEQFEAFDKMEKDWIASVKSIFSEKEFVIYSGMRELNEKEKAKAYKEYHDYLRKKHGDTFTYNISEDQSIREKAINQKYLKELLKVVGEEKFQTYVKARDKINEDNRKSGKEFIQVEF